MTNDDDTGPRFVAVGRRKAATAARAYVYSVAAAMLNHQYAASPENVEGWMFGGVTNEFDRRRVMLEIKRLEREMNRRAAKLGAEVEP